MTKIIYILTGIDFWATRYRIQSDSSFPALAPAMISNTESMPAVPFNDFI
ncbi:MAG: hypothetical protein RBU23_02255 [Candidatus Auribacterota bacterium]|nr:hypothetical protein [Candidatus Auribacterota bacterium]